MSALWPILRNAARHPRRTAVIDDRRSFTYGQLLAGAFYMADAISFATSRKHVGLMLPTSGAAPLALLGAWIAGKVPVPLNYLLAKEELRYVLRDSDIDTVVTVKPMLEFLSGEGKTGTCEYTGATGPGRDVIPGDIKIVLLEDVSFKGFPTPRFPPLNSPDDLAVILYTSGTSGKPKGVMLTHGNLRSDVLGSIQLAQIQNADKFLGILPQFHSFGLTALTLMPLYVGSTVVYTARFIPRKIVQLLEEHRPEVFMAVPSMYGALLSVKGMTADTWKSVRFPVSGGEPLPRATYDTYLNDYGLRILEGYGLTETSPVTHWSTQHEGGQKVGHVGRTLPCVKTYIVDEHNRPLGPNVDGEIIIVGPNVMKGYYKLPQQTGEVLFDFTTPAPGGETVRAFRTGDIGRVDEEGFLAITGRKKEMLIIGGENVFPREIEEVLNAHPMVKDSAVVGKQDGMRGEVPIAFVEVAEGVMFDETKLREHCRDRLATFKCPREIRVIDQLPRNPTGKILRRKLTA